MRRLAAALVVAATAVAGCGSGLERGGVCDLVVAPDGSAGAAGTLAQPLSSPQELADRLQPGQTGCLREGRYAGRRPQGYVLRFATGGEPGAPVTVRGYPGERPVLAGVVYVVRGADHVRLSSLSIDDPTPFDAAKQITVQVNARDTVLEALDITTHGRKTCVILGSIGRFGPAIRTTIRDSVLRDCGDPANELRDHAVYVGNARSVRIEDNLIVGAGGFAVQLYPNARQTLIRDNVMASNGGGVIFAGEGKLTSTANVVEHNVIADSTLAPNVASYWPRDPGEGNVARDNCLFAGPGGNFDPEGGFSRSDNIAIDPGMTDDFRLPYSSPCLEHLGMQVAAAALRRSAR